MHFLPPTVMFIQSPSETLYLEWLLGLVLFDQFVKEVREREREYKDRFMSNGVLLRLDKFTHRFIFSNKQGGAKEKSFVRSQEKIFGLLCVIRRFISY